MIIVTDSHVSQVNGNHQSFFKMLKYLETLPDDIIFLGDIFDLWISLPGYEEEIQRQFLTWCSRNKTKRSIGFVEGNHEFYVVERNPEPFTWSSQSAYLQPGKPWLFVHGDLINTADKNYLRFRRITKNKLAKFFFRWLPFGPKIAHKLKQKLKKTNRQFRIGLPKTALDEFAHRQFQTGVQNIFVGHFHQEYKVQGAQGEKLHVLPAWFGTEKICQFDETEGTVQSFDWREKLPRNA